MAHPTFFRDTIVLKGPAGLIPLSGAAVRFYYPDGGTPPTAYPHPLYPGPDATAPVPSPYLTGPNGELEVWGEERVRLRVVVEKPGYLSVTEVIDLEPEPDSYATDQEVADAVAAHEARTDPHPRYLNEEEGDERYLPVSWAQQPDPLPQYLTRADADPLYASATHDHDARYFTEAEADARFQGLDQKGMPNGYPSLDPAGLIPTSYLPPLAITDTFVAASEAEMLALTAERGDVCIRSDEEKTYILAADPASVLANWTELASSGLAGQVTVLKSEEFAPAAAATTVTLAAVPTTVHQVFRNGVEQSAAQGHYSVAGSVLTFTDAFAAGEVVAVTYEVGTSLPVDSYTKAESDTRYVNVAGDTMTGNLIRDGADLTDRIIEWRTNGELRWRMGVIDTEAETGPDYGSDFRLQYYWSDGAPHDLFWVDRNIGQLFIPAEYANVRILGGYGISVAESYDLQPGRWDINPINIKGFSYGETYPRMDIEATGGGITLRSSGAASSPNVQLQASGAMFQIMGATSVATLSSYQAALGSGTRRWTDLYAGNVIDVRKSGGTVSARLGQINTTAPRADLTANAWHDGSQWLRDDTAKRSARITLLDGDLYFSNAAPAANPLAWTDRLTISQTGTLTLTPDAATVPLAVNRPEPMAPPASTPMIAFQRAGTPRWYAGVDHGDQFTLYSAAVAGRLNVSQTGTLTLTPDAGQWALVNTGGGIYEDAPGTQTLLQLRSKGVDKAVISYAGTLTLTPDASTAHIRSGTNTLDLGAGGSGVGAVYLRPHQDMSSNWAIQANNSWGFGPAVDNQASCGHPVTRWTLVAAVAGTINTSSREVKDAITPLDPAACAQAVLGTDWVNFSYLPPALTEGGDAEAHARMVEETAFARRQRGYVLGSPDHRASDLFGLSDRKSASPSSDLAVVACALQQALKDIADLKARLA